MTITIIKKARPNGFYIEFGLDEDPGYDSCYYVQEGDDDQSEFWDDKVAAEAYYEERLKELQGTPNWEAQARYDEQHGTVNGY